MIDLGSNSALNTGNLNEIRNLKKYLDDAKLLMNKDNVIVGTTPGGTQGSRLTINTLDGKSVLAIAANNHSPGTAIVVQDNTGDKVFVVGNSVEAPVEEQVLLTRKFKQKIPQNPKDIGMYKQLISFYDSTIGKYRVFVRNEAKYVELSDTQAAVKFNTFVNGTITSTGKDINEFLVLLSDGNNVTRYDGQNRKANFYKKNHNNVTFRLYKSGLITTSMGNPPSNNNNPIPNFNVEYALPEYFILNAPYNKNGINSVWTDTEDYDELILYADPNNPSIGTKKIKFNYWYSQTYNFDDSSERVRSGQEVPAYPQAPLRGSPDGVLQDQYIIRESGVTGNSGASRGSPYPPILSSAFYGSPPGVTPDIYGSGGGNSFYIFNNIQPNLNSPNVSVKFDYIGVYLGAYTVRTDPDDPRYWEFGGYNIQIKLRVESIETNESGSDSGLISGGFYFDGNIFAPFANGFYSYSGSYYFLNNGGSGDVFNPSFSGTATKREVLNEIGSTYTWTEDYNGNSNSGITENQLVLIARDASPFLSPNLSLVIGANNLPKVINTQGSILKTLNLPAYINLSDISQNTTFTSSIWYIGVPSTTDRNKVKLYKWDYTTVFESNPKIVTLEMAKIPALASVSSINLINYISFDAGAKLNFTPPNTETDPDAGGGGGGGGTIN